MGNMDDQPTEERRTEKRQPASVGDAIADFFNSHKWLRVAFIAAGLLAAIFVLSRLLKKQREPRIPPAVSAMMEASMAGAKKDAGPLLEALRDRNYAEAYAWLDPRLASLWKQEDFAEMVGSIRERIGSRWKPVVVGWYKQPTASGPICSTTLSLTGMFPGCSTAAGGTGEFILLLHSSGGLARGRIFYWIMDRPCDRTDPEVPAARKTASRFVSHFLAGEHDAACGLMTDQLRSQFGPQQLAQFRRVCREGMQLEVSRITRKLANARWYYCAVASEKGGASSITVVLEEDGAAMKVAMVEPKIKMAGPPSAAGAR